MGADIGGDCSTVFASVALAGLADDPPRLATHSASRPYFENMVSATFNSFYSGGAAPDGTIDMVHWHYIYVCDCVAFRAIALLSGLILGTQQ